MQIGHAIMHPYKLLVSNSQPIACVVVPIFNRAQATLICVDSIINGVPADIPIILIDDYSSDGAKQIADQYAYRCVVISNKKNLGLCKSLNIAFDLARKMGSKHIIRINNDIRITAGLFDGLIQAAKLPGIGVVGPIYTHQIAELWKNQQPHLKGRGIIHVQALAGHCMLITNRLLARGWRWDENMYPMGPDDMDVCLFSLANGMMNVVARAATCEVIRAPHSKTFRNDEWDRGSFPPHVSRYFWRKWGRAYKNMLSRM